VDGITRTMMLAEFSLRLVLLRDLHPRQESMVFGVYKVVDSRK
jgi:hypothetical protein